jgi:outer membrane protein OmpU
MNNIKKIGLSALAGSLVAMSAHADVSVSGSASIAIGSTHDSDKTYYYQNDSITFSHTGETDGGLTVTTSLELDGDASGGAGGDFDSQSVKISSEGMGTITYAGHGGSSVMGGWDDMMPTAYEEVFALTKDTADGTTSGNLTIAGFGGNGLWRYDSPSFSGVSFHAAYQSAAATGRTSSYSDMGVQIAPEMVDGLTIGYAQGEYDESATVLGVDVSTVWVKYVYGSLTVGYQESEDDGPTSATTDSSKSMAVSYAVTDDFSVSYGQHEYDDGDTSLSDQESSGFSASYTMGGTTISAAFNETDNIRGVASNDEDSYEIALSFAF